MPENTTQNSLGCPQEPSKKHTGLTIGILIGLGALIAAVILILSLTAEDPPQKESPETESYAAVIGQHELTAAEANYFYIDYINKAYDSWRGSYGVHADMYMQILLQLDTSAPLDKQYYDEAQHITWADHFADQAMQDAAVCYAFYDRAKAENFKLSDSDQADLNAQVDRIRLLSQEQGYRFPVEYIRSVYGEDADMDSYKDYLEIRAVADAFSRHVENSFTYDDADLRAYEADKYHQFSSFTYCQYYINVSDYLTGGVADTDGNITYSPDQMQAADDKAKKIAGKIAQSKACNKEELDQAIAKLDAEHGISESKEDVLYENLPASLADWMCYDARKAGDITTIAETSVDSSGSTVTNGYSVVMFLGRNENLINLVNVRHILVAYEGGFTLPDGSAIYPEANKNAALARANEIFDLYIAGEQTEDAFAALAVGHSDDTDSVSRGGLYENVYPLQMVQPFSEWCFDKNRKVGDVEIIESEYGFHLMYYCGTSPVTYRDYLITEILQQQDISAWRDAVRADMTVSELDTHQLKTDHIIKP